MRRVVPSAKHVLAANHAPCAADFILSTSSAGVLGSLASVFIIGRGAGTDYDQQPSLVSLHPSVGGVSSVQPTGIPPRFWHLLVGAVPDSLTPLFISTFVTIEFTRKYVDGLRHPIDRLPIQLNAVEARANKKAKELEEVNDRLKLTEDLAEATKDRAEAAEAKASETAAKAEEAATEAAEAKAREKEALAKSESLSSQMREAQVMAEEARAQAKEATARAVQAEAQAEEAVAQSADFDAERQELLTSMDSMRTSMADTLAKEVSRAAAAEAKVVAAEAAAAEAAAAIATLVPEVYLPQPPPSLSTFWPPFSLPFLTALLSCLCPS